MSYAKHKNILARNTNKIQGSKHFKPLKLKVTKVLNMK